MTIYVGKRVQGHALVLKDGRPFDAARSLQVRNHSPTGFNWGYMGSGPAQLALALLLDVLGDELAAQRYYQAFKADQVATWPESWSIDAAQIRAWVDLQRLAEEVDEEVERQLRAELDDLGEGLGDGQADQPVIVPRGVRIAE